MSLVEIRNSVQKSFVSQSSPTIGMGIDLLGYTYDSSKGTQGGTNYLEAQVSLKLGSGPRSRTMLVEGGLVKLKLSREHEGDRGTGYT